MKITTIGTGYVRTVYGGSCSPTDVQALMETARAARDVPANKILSHFGSRRLLRPFTYFGVGR